VLASLVERYWWAGLVIAFFGWLLVLLTIQLARERSGRDANTDDLKEQEGAGSVVYYSFVEKIARILGL
jgi:hypothetical protein